MLKESVNNQLEYQRLSQDEMKKRGILGRLVGVCADFFSPTRNGRRYPEQLWENVFNDPIMKERIENGVCYGELGHPTDREETDMSKIALCLAEVPKKGKDGKLRAVFDILNTPNGRILKSLCDYGSTIGISSRGSGDLETDFDGNESVNPDTYNCEGFDAVLIPAVKEARLEYVTESLNKKRYNKTLRDKLTESINKEDESNQKIMRESLSTLGINLNESVSEYKGTHKDIDIYFLPDENKYSVDTLTEGIQKFNSLKNAISYIDMINRTKLNENKPNSVMSNESLVVSAGKIPDELLDKAIKLYSETSEDYDTVLDFVKDFFSQYSRVDQKDIARYIFNRTKLTESKSRKTPGYCYVITFDDGGKRSVMSAEYGFETKEEARKALADAESEYIDSPFWDDTVKKSVRLIKESLLDEEQTGREETKLSEKPSDILDMKDTQEVDIENEDSDILEEQAEEDTLDRESEPERQSWDTDFYRLYKAYDNYKDFKDIDIESAEIRDLIDPLEDRNIDYDIYKHKSDNGCTVFFNEGLTQDLDEALSDLQEDIDYSDIPEIKSINYKQNKSNMMPGISNMSKFISALNDVGYDKFKIRSSRFPLSQADVKDEWIDIKRNGWSVGLSYDSSLNGFNEVYICTKLPTTESLNLIEELNGTEALAVDRVLDTYKNYDSLEDCVLDAINLYNNGNAEPEYSDEDFATEEADYNKVLKTVKNKLDMKVESIAAENDGALIEQLQNIIKQNKSLEQKITEIQEKLSVSYAKEMKLTEQIECYKQKVSKLSEKTKEIKVLNEKLSKAQHINKQSKLEAEDSITKLNESIKSKDDKYEELVKTNTSLKESIGQKDSTITSLKEEIRKLKLDSKSKLRKVEELEESLSTTQKDLDQFKEQYSKKLQKQNTVIEKYQRVAKNSVKKYIESQAVRLGVKSEEITNRLPKSYSFKDIDLICEDLQEYKFNMSNLPFNTTMINENLKVSAKNVNENNQLISSDDLLTDYDLKLAEALL